jgi:CRP/FNR family cyclic AMP-dependent transcriptional regulator
MTQKELVPILRELRFLHGVSDEHLEQIAEVARLVKYAKGDTIFREGEPYANVYLIVDGEVSLEICAPGRGCQRILTVGTGELLGWSPLLEQTHATVTARTLTPVSAVAINGGQMLTLCEHNPTLGYEFMRHTALAMAQRISATRVQLLNVYGTEVPTIPEKGGE